MLSALHGTVLERITVSVLVRNLSSYYGNGKLITIVTRNHHKNILLHIISYQCIVFPVVPSIHIRRIKFNNRFATFQPINNSRRLYWLLASITFNRMSRIHVRKNFIMRFSSLFYHFSITSKFSIQHPVLKQSPATYFPQVDIPTHADQYI